MGKKKEAKKLALLQQRALELEQLEKRKESLLKKRDEAPVDGQGFYETPAQQQQQPNQQAPKKD